VGAGNTTPLTVSAIMNKIKKPKREKKINQNKTRKTQGISALRVTRLALQMAVTMDAVWSEE